MTNEEIFAALAAPFKKEELLFRPGAVTKDKTKCLPLVYIDSRTVQERLDQVMGVENWQNTHIREGNSVVCQISLRLNGEWITKSDGAGETAMEGEKGAFSDALKRTAVLWGIGRYLYDCKGVWVPYDEARKGFPDKLDLYSYFKFPKAPSDILDTVKNKDEPIIINKDRQLIVNIPFTEDGKPDWNEYVELVFQQLDKIKTWTQFSEFRKGNKHNFDRLEHEDEKLRKQLSEYGKKKAISLKAPEKPPLE